MTEVERNQGSRPSRLGSALLLLSALCLGSVLAAASLSRDDYGMLVCAAALTALTVAALLRPVPSPLKAQPSERDETAPADDLLAAAPDPVVVVDRRAVVTESNVAAQAIVPGLRSRQPLAFALRAPQVLDAIRQTFRSGEGRDVEFGGLSAADPVYQVRLRLLGAPGSEGETLALFFRDLSAERRLESMRVDFIATVSHELRTPLASLAGFIDTLKGPARNDPAARERFLDIMRGQANRMARLVDDLLQLSRVELKAHVAPVTPIDLGPLVHHMIEVMAPLARERGVEIALAFDDGPLEVLGDRDELLRVVENLVENALKYGSSGGRIEIGLHRSEDGRVFELTIRDHGPGIAPEHLPRVTERFYRVDVAESRTQGGTGLGLAIVKHIVGRHRGRLAIESEPGEGATARVQLPVGPGTAARI
ncbi:sensor histidine kinase [uncultured Enterovirga sp.]|uniref:sensor histidine kinase n=1 Tax=uncultured Enterovirga sp. TaxID=2026352 RepID=UPI0035C9EBFD